MDKNGLPWEENDYVKMNICVQINGLKMQQFWTDSLDDPVVASCNAECGGGAGAHRAGSIIFPPFQGFQVWEKQKLKLLLLRLPYSPQCKVASGCCRIIMVLIGSFISRICINIVCRAASGLMPVYHCVTVYPAYIHGSLLTFDVPMQLRISCCILTLTQRTIPVVTLH